MTRQVVHYDSTAPPAAHPFGRPDTGAKPMSLPTQEPLTPRERTVLELIVKGATSREASTTLGISPRTIEFHRANIMQKFAAKNVADLMRMVMTP